MVKIKAGMSADSSDGEGEALAAVKDKLKIQQRLIDISARSLLSSRSSTADLSQSFESQSALEVQRENSSLQETRLMRFFSRQLLVKHMFLPQCHGNNSAAIEREIDDLIDLGLFLNVADLQPRSVQLLKQEQLSLDGLFALSTADLESLCVRLGLSREEEGKLKTYLSLLTSCYSQLERDTADKSFSYDRYYSSSSRLSSVSTPGSLDERQDSLSSIPSSAASHTPAGSVFTLLSPRPYSTTTITSTPSLLSPALLPSSPCPPHLPNGSAPYHSTPRPLTPTSQSPTLSRNTSLSSSVLCQDMEHSEPCEPAHRPARTSHSYLQQRHSHMRSHSNPHAHLIMEEAEPRRSSPGPPPEDLRSPSPPHRANSQSSVAILGSPGSTQRRPNHHLRRPHPLAPGCTHMGGGEQLAPESPVLRSSAYSSSHYDYPVRSNSLTYSERRASSMSYQTHGHQHSVEGGGPHSHGVISASMVDLPAMNYAASTEYLGDIEEYPLSSNSSKSQSVPKLTLLTISTDDKNGSTSVPTSPRSPGSYTPTGHMGHAIKHRFTAKTFPTPHLCTVCKKTMILGVKCKHCHYRCHRGCADKAPHSCGLPPELMKFFRQQILKKGSSSSFDAPSSSEPFARRPTITRGQTYDPDTRETAEDEFIIPELSKEPAKGQYSPVMGRKKLQGSPAENGRRVLTQPSSTSLLEVPVSRSHHHGGYHSVSSSPSPSSSPPSSPSLTPSTPRSPRSPYPMGPAYTYSQIPDVIYTDESENESLDGDHLRRRGFLGSQSPTSFASKDSISDLDRMRSASPKGLRPPPQVVPAHSLPDLLLGHKSVENSEESSEGSDGTYSRHQSADKKASIVSATESHASTLISSYPSQPDEEDAYSESYDSSQGLPDDYSRKHRNSVVDEWNISLEEVKMLERVGRGPLGEVFQGYWHGQVAIKKFFLDENCYKRQLHKLKEEVSILKKTRHHNLALFMGASLNPPNLAIVTSFCRGNTLHKHLHIWGETFIMEKTVSIMKQIATGMGYLHARGIVHKGLHTRNVFLDKEKVVITDTGLSSVSDSLCLPSRQSKHFIVIPRTKLNYMAPELMKEIRCCPRVLKSGDIYHYTEKTDIYAFGTVFYEMLTRRYPCPSHDSTGFPIDVTMVIYQVGRGHRQDIPLRDAPKRIKDLVWDCWQLEARKRPPFSTVWDILSKVLRKKTPIGRSPSVPTALSRSSEDLLKLSSHLN